MTVKTSQLENKGNMMASAPSELERRVTELEAEVKQLKHQVDKFDHAAPWWEQIVGTFENDPVYEAAMKQGRQYRESLRPKASPRGKQ